jgi:hypothetical protein
MSISATSAGKSRELFLRNRSALGITAVVRWRRPRPAVGLVEREPQSTSDNLLFVKATEARAGEALREPLAK